MIMHLLAPLVTLAAALVLVGGCGAPGSTLSLQQEPEQLCAPTQEVRDLYATARTVISNKIAVEEAQCRANRRSVSTCDALRKQHADLRMLDFDLKRKIENPKSTLDVKKIIRVLEGLGSVVGALTLRAHAGP